MSVLQVELDDIIRLEADGKTFVLNPDAEDSIEKLFKIKDNIEVALENIAQEIKKQGEDINPDFKGVRGTKVKASNRVYGSEYKISDKIEDIEKEIDGRYLNKSVRFTPNTDTIKEFVKSHGSTPTGITIIKREKKIALKLIE